ncbi:Protein RST1, partial [Bienertia sinuspersici]
GLGQQKYLCEGACGIGLGYSCQDLLTWTVAVDKASIQGSFYSAGESSLAKIVRNISLTIRQLTKISSDVLVSLSEFKVPGLEDDIRMTSALILKSDEGEEDDVWGVTALVLGLGMSVSALSRAGSYDAMCNIKDLLTSWVEQADSTPIESTSGCQIANMMLATGACLALPCVLSFCRRVEKIHDNELNGFLFCYEDLISKLQLQKNSNIFHPNMLLASCVGAGSLLAFILDEGLISLDVQRIKNLLCLYKEIYTSPYPHLVHFGAFLGVESSYVNVPLLSNSTFAEDLLVLVQDMFLVVQDSSDSQLQAYASWAIAFLCHHLWLNEAKNEIASFMPMDQSFSKDSTILKLSSWLMQLDRSTNPSHINTVAAVLRCLSSAPRLPQLDWGTGSRISLTSYPQDSSYEKGILLKECLVFSLAHANKFDQLLSLLDELTSLFRFRTLDLITQSCLLFHLIDLMRIFSSSRIHLLFEDISEFLSSPISSFQNYNARQKRFLQFSFWKGLSKCFIDASLDASEYLSGIERCMEILFALLPAQPPSAFSKQELIPCLVWNESVLCLGKARRAWLLNLLQTSAVDLVPRGEQFGITLKKMLAISKLVKLGFLPMTELAKLKSCMLNTQSQGLWELFVEVMVVLQTAEGSMKRQWLVDVLEISCVTKYPSTALQFLGLLSGCFCKCMPLLILDPQHVLVDLPVTLSSLFSNTKWRLAADVAVSYLWKLTVRIYNWAKTLKNDFEQPGLGIDPSEVVMSKLLVQVLLDSCCNLKEFLPLKNQLLLANMVV